MRRALPLLLALAAAIPVWLVSTSIDNRYEATASTRIQVLFPTEELFLLRDLAGLSRTTEAALLPDAAASLRRVEERTAARLGWDEPFESDDVRVVDTAAELGTGKLNESVRRLKVKAVAEGAEDAARLANFYLAEYLRERDRSVDRLLSEARDALRAGPTPATRAVAPAGRAELAEAADIASELEGGVLTFALAPAAPPEERISPKPLRDTVVAALIGVVAGLLIRRRGQPSRP